MAVRLRQAPGIDAVSIAAIPPLRRLWIEHSGSQQLYMNAVDPSYFPMMRLPLVAGHMFAADEQDAIVVSESAAHRLWPNESPLGKSCRIAMRAHTVAGIVKDSGVNLISHPESVEVYTPLDDKHAVFATIMAHARDNPAQMAGALRSAATLPRTAGITSPANRSRNW